MQSWLSSSLKRIYPRSEAEACSSLALEAARGERVSFQVAFRREAQERRVTATVEAPDGVQPLVRRVGFVPMPHFSTQVPPDDADGVGHLPGYVPDPLFPETTIHAGPYESNAFWITLLVGADAHPGTHEVRVTLTPEGETPTTLTATLTIHPALLPARRDFPVTHWFYADALMDYYKVEP